MSDDGATPNPLAPWGEGIWTVEGRSVPFLTVPYPTRMILVRLGDGALVVISPIRLSDTDLAAVDAQGPVRHILSPNKIHHLFMGEWRDRYPEAKLYASPGLAEKRADLTFAAQLGDEPEDAWARELDQTVLRGSVLMEEVEFFHKASRTLIVTDCIQRFDPKRFNLFHRLLMWANGLLGVHGGMPRDWRASFTDHAAMRASVEKMIAWDPERIVIAHGMPVESGGADYLRDVFKWLLK